MARLREYYDPTIPTGAPGQTGERPKTETIHKYPVVWIEKSVEGCLKVLERIHSGLVVDRNFHKWAPRNADAAEHQEDCVEVLALKGIADLSEVEVRHHLAEQGAFGRHDAFFQWLVRVERLEQGSYATIPPETGPCWQDPLGRRYIPIVHILASRLCRVELVESIPNKGHGPNVTYYAFRPLSR